MKSFVFGFSRNELCIPAFRFGQQGPRVLLLAGVHGDEIEGVALAQHLLGQFNRNFGYHIQLVLVPMFNIDGVLAGTRKNAFGVDLNRNLPSKDWTSDVANERYFPGTTANSEPENKALTSYLELEKTDFIISLHSFSKALINVNGNCAKVAERMNSITDLPIEESMGYPTPGCLGTYTGLEKGIPTITYELPRGADIKSILELHSRSIKEAFKIIETEYKQD